MKPNCKIQPTSVRIRSDGTLDIFDCGRLLKTIKGRYWKTAIANGKSVFALGSAGTIIEIDDQLQMHTFAQKIKNATEILWVNNSLVVHKDDGTFDVFVDRKCIKTTTNKILITPTPTPTQTEAYNFATVSSQEDSKQIEGLTAQEVSIPTIKTFKTTIANLQPSPTISQTPSPTPTPSPSPTAVFDEPTTPTIDDQPTTKVGLLSKMFGWLK